ncbi:hypothetical protein HDU67_001097 [Dinochytrium kinnereticum]|nr:hypothetical protein HDU67_001097 [Dinochytrium kinnereticum]
MATVQPARPAADVHRESLRDLLNQKARITATDGRVFVGVFMCLDKERNLILSGTEEFKAGEARATLPPFLIAPPSFAPKGERRFVGLIMVPGKHIVKAEIEDNSHLYSRCVLGDVTNSSTVQQQQTASTTTNKRSFRNDGDIGDCSVDAARSKRLKSTITPGSTTASDRLYLSSTASSRQKMVAARSSGQQNPASGSRGGMRAGIVAPRGVGAAACSSAAKKPAVRNGSLISSQKKPVVNAAVPCRVEVPTPVVNMSAQRPASKTRSGVREIREDVGLKRRASQVDSVRKKTEHSCGVGLTEVAVEKKAVTVSAKSFRSSSYNAADVRTGRVERIQECNIRGTEEYDVSCEDTLVGIEPDLMMIDEPDNGGSTSFNSKSLTVLYTESADPSVLSEYATEIYEYARKMEIETMPKANYIDSQPEIDWKMRSELINWMVEVHCKLRLLPETLYFAVNLVDRFLSLKPISVPKLLLVGVTSLFIACKYEEVQIPSVAVMVYMVNNMYDASEITKAERFMLHLLKFDLGYPGPLIFLRKISRADNYNPHVRLLAKYLLEATLADEQFLKFRPSFLSAASMYLALKLLSGGEWTPMHVACSGYSEEEVFPCAKALFHLVASPSSRLPSILKKYSDVQFSKVALFVADVVQRMATTIRSMSEAKGKANASTMGPVPDLNVVTQIWGFDPMELLATVEFPNDRYERLLRRSKEARLLAIRRQGIPLSPDSSEAPSVANLDAKSDYFYPISSSLNINLDAANGLRASSALHRAQSPALLTPISRKEEIALKEQLARSAASILIQCAFRGWIVRRKYVAVVYYHLTKQSVTSGESKIYNGLPDVDDLSVQERLLRRFKMYCRFFEKADKLLPDFPYFCAAQIQSVFRMFIVRRSWLRIKYMTKEDKLGSAGKEARQEIVRLTERADFRAGTWTDAAKKIQRAWRRYYIYRFYRELIRFREKGDPRKLLKFVNPKEAQLIDGASGIHVRFRLGGTKFPPTIYYKIFVHSRLVDMNAFSPRDYTKETKQVQPRVLFTKKFDLPSQKSETDGWYQRYENNGWRPVSDRVWDERNDEISVATSVSPVAFHFSNIKRRQEIERKRKQKKLKWLRTMYDEGRRAKRADNFEELAQEDESEADPVFDKEEDLLKAINELEVDLDHDLMRKWASALDFEDYVKNWTSISMTGKSDGNVKMLLHTLTNNRSDPSTFEMDIDGDSDIGQGMAKKLRHVREFSKFEESGAEEGDELMAEIDLFRRIADETQQSLCGGADASSESALEEAVAPGGEGGGAQRKERPWSGRSGRSVQDVFLSSSDAQADFF